MSNPKPISPKRRRRQVRQLVRRAYGQANRLRRQGWTKEDSARALKQMLESTDPDNLDLGDRSVTHA